MGALLLFAGRVSLADGDDGLELRWTAPASCATEAEVRAKVERYLGRPSATRGAFAARGVVGRERGERWRLMLAIAHHGDERTRTIEGDSCEAVSNAGALVLAFAIDPNAAGVRAALPAPDARLAIAPASAIPVDTAAPPVPTSSIPMPAEPAFVERAPAERATAEPVTLRPNEAPPVRAPAPDAIAERRATTHEPRWIVRALAGVDAGALPQATGFAGLGVGRLFGPVSLELSGAYFAPRQRSIDGPNGPSGGRFDLALLAATSCYFALARRLELGPCAGVEYGTVRASGFGVGDPGSGRGMWLAASAALAARWRASRFIGVAAEAGVALPLVRPEYVLDNVGPVYRSDFITVRGLGGLEAYF